MDFGRDRSDERLGALYFALLDIVGHSHEPTGLSVLFDEHEGKFLLLEPRPLRGELEEHGIETELEFVLPLLDLLVSGTGIRKGIESSTGLVIRDDEFLVVDDFDTVDLPSELYPIEENTSECGAEIVLEMQISVRFPGDLGVERIEILATPIEEIPLGVLGESFLLESGLEGREERGFGIESRFLVIGEKYLKRLMHSGPITRGFALGLREPEDVVRHEMLGTAIRDIQKVLECGHGHSELLRDTVGEEIPLLPVVREGEKILAFLFHELSKRFRRDSTTAPCRVQIGQTSERSIGFFGEVHLRIGEDQIFLGTGEYRVDQTSDILVIILLRSQWEVLRKRGTGNLPELVLLLGETDGIDPPVLEPLRLVDGYEVHGRSFVPHEVRCRYLHVVLLHERDELAVIEDGEESRTFLEGTDGFHEFADIGQMSSIHRRIARNLFATEIIPIDGRNILFLPSSEHIDLNGILSRIFVILIRNLERVGSGDVIHEIFEPGVVREDGELDQKIREACECRVRMRPKRFYPTLPIGKL